jgi:hypothetical protein
MGKQAEAIESTVAIKDDAVPKVFYGWDVYSLLVLSIILSGTIPLATGTGIAIAFALSGPLAWWSASLIGFGSFLVMIFLQVLVLWTITRKPVRQRFIPWARKWFPSSDEIAGQSSRR